MITQPRIATIAAAALLAGSMVVATATTTTAAANPDGRNQWTDQNHGYRHGYYNRGYGNYDRGYGYYNNYDDGGALVAGLLGGMFGGALANSYDRPYYNGNACYRFKTYNPATGMYMSYSGPRHCP